MAPIEVIPPGYAGQSLLNVPPSVCAALAVPSDGLGAGLDAAVLPPAMLAGVRAVLVLVVDGLGRWQLDRGIEAGEAPTLAALAERARAGAPEASLASITSVFPSSTVPALATLSTGLPPAAHGLMGWTVYLEEFGEVAELARWGPAAGVGGYQDVALGHHDAARFFGLPTLYQRVAAAGVRAVVVCPAEFRGSGLSAMTFQGAEFVGYHATSSVFVLAERVLAERRPEERLYVYAYWNPLDAVSHHHGPLAAEHGEELATLDFVLGRWLARRPVAGDLLVLITADHGHVPSDPAGLVLLDQERGLLEGLIAPPTGERRLVYLHTRAGATAAVRRTWAERLASVATWLDPADAFGQGLFGPGPVSAAARRRVGDAILVARGDHQLAYSFSAPRAATPFLGNHGALDPREMLVPLLAIRR